MERSSTVGTSASSEKNQQHMNDQTEIVTIQDTDVKIDKVLDQYEGLNIMVGALDLLDHEIKEYEARLRDLSSLIASKQREARQLELDINKMSKKSEPSGFVAKIRHGIGQSPGYQQAEQEEHMRRSRDEASQEVADLKTEVVYLLMSQHEEADKALKLEREDFQWARVELNDLLAHVFDGPSPSYPHEDELEEVVSSFQRRCDQLSADIDKYWQARESISKATAEIDKGIKVISEAREVCEKKDGGFARALEIYEQVRPIARAISALIVPTIDVLPAVQLFNDEFGDFPLYNDLRVKPSNPDYNSLLRSLKESSDRFVVLKYQLARTAQLQIAKRLSEAKVHLVQEKLSMEAAKTRLFAVRRLIIDRAWWERAASEYYETWEDMQPDFPFDSQIGSSSQDIELGNRGSEQAKTTPPLTPPLTPPSTQSGSDRDNADNASIRSIAIHRRGIESFFSPTRPQTHSGSERDNVDSASIRSITLHRRGVESFFSDRMEPMTRPPTTSGSERDNVDSASIRSIIIHRREIESFFSNRMEATLRPPSLSGSELDVNNLDSASIRSIMMHRRGIQSYSSDIFHSARTDPSALSMMPSRQRIPSISSESYRSADSRSSGSASSIGRRRESIDSDAVSFYSARSRPSQGNLTSLQTQMQDHEIAQTLQTIQESTETPPPLSLSNSSQLPLSNTSHSHSINYEPATSESPQTTLTPSESTDTSPSRSRPTLDTSHSQSISNHRPPFDPANFAIGMNRSYSAGAVRYRRQMPQLLHMPNIARHVSLDANRSAAVDARHDISPGLLYLRSMGAVGPPSYDSIVALRQPNTAGAPVSVTASSNSPAILEIDSEVVPPSYGSIVGRDGPPPPDDPNTPR
ncbi:hypothetical protein BJ742DRAFT_773406 [Cladochytrium replicatum]|nr:hypothetical protein BJ742DRAFT_773406 [Cladochytrium replicatum]